MTVPTDSEPGSGSSSGSDPDSGPASDYSSGSDSNSGSGSGSGSSSSSGSGSSSGSDLGSSSGSDSSSNFGPGPGPGPGERIPKLSFPTSLGTSDAEHISLLGHDLTEDLMGHVGFGELAFWLIARRRPSPGESRVFEAVLIGLADHGFTPTAIAARLTYLSAPDAVQGALAAGLLGGGSRFLGVTEDTGRFLTQVLTAAPSRPTDDAGWDELAREAVRRQRAAGAFVPGLGHPVHKQQDPRTPRIIALAREEGVYGPHLSLFEAIGRTHGEVLGRTLPLNGAGVSGAALADLGLPAPLLRAAVLLARCAGLIGHLAEEMQRPVANDIYLAVDRNASYVPLE